MARSRRQLERVCCVISLQCGVKSQASRGCKWLHLCGGQWHDYRHGCHYPSRHLVSERTPFGSNTARGFKQIIQFQPPCAVQPT